LQAIHGNNLVPVEIDGAVGSREHGLAAQVRGSEVLARESVGGTGERMKGGVLDGDGSTFHQRRTLRVRDLRRRESAFNSLERKHGRWRGPVVIALQSLDEFGGGPDYGDARDSRLERQDAILIFEQHDRFPGGP
jgi:hypothetical protein